MIILPSLEIVPAKYNGSTLLSQIPIDGTGDFTVTRATTPTTGQSTRVNALGQIELVADNVPRLDYPIGGGCPALLVEPAATNSIRNNSMVGAVVGTPGTLPTNYQLQLAGLTRTIVGTGTENGIAYMDIRVSGTSTGGAVVLQEESSTFITAAQGQVWTHSVYAKLIANVLNMPSIRVGMYEYTSGGVYLTEGSTPFSLTTSLNRFSSTRTLANASTTRVAPIVQWIVNNGVSYDFTIRIGYPQMEQSSVATSVIPTTTAAVTRSADVVTNTVASSLIGQTEGTIYAEVDVRNLGLSRSFMNVQDASYATNAVRIESQGNNWRIQIRAASVTILDQTIGSPVFATGIYKVAFAYSTTANGVAFAVNGTVIYTNASALTMPSGMDRVHLGTRFITGNFDLFLNDRILAAALYTTRLTNAELALITQP